MPRKKNPDYIFCRERTKHGGAYYYTKGVGLTIACKYEGIFGKITGWELAIAPSTIYTGTTKEELISTLHEIWPDLKWHCDKTKDKIVIYTDNIHKVQGFFEDHKTGVVSDDDDGAFDDFYVELDEFFEIRPCDRWMDEKTALGIATQAQKVIDVFFIPEKYFYITPQQRNRKFLAKAVDDDTAAKSYPTSYETYTTLRKGYFSGLLYKPFTSDPITEPMLVLDITSSYIFDLLCCKHVLSSRKRQRDLSMWEYYLSSATKASVGMYDISYCTPRSYVQCYADVNGVKLEPGEHKVTMVLTSVDMQNLLNLGYIKEVKPIWLYEYEMGSLPKYFLDALVDSYIAKATAKDKKEKDIKKPILNGWYGDTIRKYDDEESFNKTRKQPALSPLWGIFTTSYAKKYLLKLALKIESINGGWYYSDTDSIICKDTPENRELLEEFNAKIRRIVKRFCEEKGYDFELLKDLGTFKIEAEIQKLKVWACKTYCYKKNDVKKKGDGEVVLKAAGLVNANVVKDDKLFTLKELDYTKMAFPIVVPAKISKTGEGYYVEISPENKAQYYILRKMLQENNKLLKNKK